MILVHALLFVVLPVLYFCLSAFMHSKRRSGIKAAIKEFNQTLVDKRIWAQWVSDCRMVGESDDGESIYEDRYTISGNFNGRPRPPRPKGALQPVLFIKKRGNELPSRFEIYTVRRACPFRIRTCWVDFFYDLHASRILLTRILIV